MKMNMANLKNNLGKYFKFLLAEKSLQKKNN